MSKVKCEAATLGPTLYFIFPVIVIVILAMFTFLLFPKVQGKHFRDHYDYDRKTGDNVPPFVKYVIRTGKLFSS